MTVPDPRSLCIIGVAQSVVRAEDGDSPEPLAVWEQVVRQAAADTGGRRVLEAIDRFDVVHCQSWQYDDPAARLAERLGVECRHGHYSGMGGTTPQLLVQHLADLIASGDVDVGVVVGAEALATKRRLKKDGRRPDWSHPAVDRNPFPFEDPFHPAEVAHQVFQAWLTFPVWDVARRAHLGAAPDDYAAAIGALMAPLSEVAASNPYAWFPVARRADDLATPTADNRLVGYPYTKHEVAVMDVDQGAAVIVASHAKADELGVSPERRVYLRGWCDAADPLYLAEREDLWRSAAMAGAGAEALRTAGVGIDDVAHLDLYSCFASSLHFAADALGITLGDDRVPTVTGGLPFAGGPGSNYVTHSLAAMVEVLRRDAGSYGLVSGVGMHMTKHAFGVYSTTPAPLEWPDVPGVRARVEATPVRAIRDEAEGAGTVAAYTVAHGRDGAAEWGLALVDLPEGDRCYARVDDAALLAEMEATEWVGAGVDLVSADGVNTARA
ncbi:MAG: hypothetical protein KDB10_03070 [Acidimicrobiales bacterium]|nr:hypothetical protein [Acidimicrobiales bacterium]MCB9373181.1 acetyl-CoA synthetase [Microthrixaceae bacterium]